MLQLKKFPDIPVSTREEARESRPHPEEPGFHLVALDDGFFSSFVWKEFPAFPSQLKRRRSQQEKREKPQCRATIPRDPQMSVHSRGTCFPCTDSTFTPRIHSLHHGTWSALGESLVGKPRGKATDPLIHATGSVTLLLQFLRRAHVHAPTGDEHRLPRGNSRSKPRSMSALKRNPQVPAPTPQKVLGPDIDRRGIPKGALATPMGTGLS